MSSQQDPPPIPQICASTVSTPSPESVTPGQDHQCGPSSSTRSWTSGRSTSGDDAVVKAKHSARSPVTLLRTPPSSELREAGYLSHRGTRSVARHTRTTTPSDSSLTPCLSPGHSPGGSRHSSDTCQSLSSNSSRDFLTPPRFQEDTDNPPYKPRRACSDSLTMADLRRASTLPDGKAHRTRRHHRKHRCRRKRIRPRGHADHSSWPYGGCQVAPTAPTGHKHICQGYAGHQIPRKTRYGNTDTYGRLLSSTNSGSLASDTGSPVTRRWSSIEIGAHQIRPELKFPKRQATSGRPNDPKDQPLSSHFDKRHRSYTFTRGAIDPDIIRTIRERLTTHKLPFPQLETPESITLRRASATSGVSGFAAEGFPSNELSGSQTPLAYPRSDSDRQLPPEAYIITRKDIDSITELIQANLKRKYRPHIRVGLNAPTPPTGNGTRTPTITNKGLVVGSGATAGSAITVAEARRSLTSSSIPVSYLQVEPATQGNKPIPHQRSIHELIWQGSGSNCSSSVTDEDDDQDEKRPSKSNYAPQVGVDNTAPRQYDSQTPNVSQWKTDKGDAFDPKNANKSINEWSWRCPQQDIQHDITATVISSDSESGEHTPSSEVPPKIRVRPPLPSHRSETKVQQIRKAMPPPRAATSKADVIPDVVSFPPLPTRSTNDWYSPLPPMNSPPLTTSKSLYDLGLDVNCGPKGSSSQVLPPKASLTSWVRTAESSAQVSRNSSVEFDPSYEVRRKSVIKLHPKAVSRVGESSAVGSSIGTSSGERRTSSTKSVTQGLKRVRTIDNKHKGERPGTWSRIRPPSICPPVKAPSPPELALDEEDGLLVGTGAGTKESRSGLVDRLSLIRDKSPPFPRADHAGIYGRLTGTGKADGRGDPCQLECTPHVCDDCAKDPRSPSIDWIG